MNLFERHRVISYHRKRLKMGKLLSLGWRTAESQSLRYDILSKITDFAGKTILEPGCGYGDFLNFINNKIEIQKYTGIDIMKSFLQNIPETYRNSSNINFISGDFSKMNFSNYDTVIASGFISYKVFDNNYYLKMISKMFEISNEVVGFNFLDSEKFGKHPIIKSHNKDDIIKHCKSLTSNLKIIEDYLPDDVTIVLYK